MTLLSPDVEARLAGHARLVPGAILDFIAILALSFLTFPALSEAWATISGAPVEAPIIGFMSDYSRPAQNGYWLIVWLSIIVAALLNAVGTLLFGASAGKALVGVRYVTFDGQRAPLWRVLKKSLFNIGLFLLAALPGPIVGFVFGSSADIVSLVMLMLAVIVAVVCWFVRDQNGLPMAYRWAGIAPVVR